MIKMYSIMISVLMMLVVGPALAKESPTNVAGAKTVNAAEAKALFDKGVLFVDVRSNKDWDVGRIPDAVHIELKKVLTEATLTKETKKSEPVVIYCNGVGCMRSSKASEKAVGWGFTDVYYFRLGLPSWKAAGYPTE